MHTHTYTHFSNATEDIPNLWFSPANCAIISADNVTSCARNKLCQPTSRSDKETDVNEEKDNCRVPVQRLPVKYERQL